MYLWFIDSIIHTTREKYYKIKYGPWLRSELHWIIHNLSYYLLSFYQICYKFFVKLHPFGILVIEQYCEKYGHFPIVSQPDSMISPTLDYSVAWTQTICIAYWYVQCIYCVYLYVLSYNISCEEMYFASIEINHFKSFHGDYLP